MIQMLSNEKRTGIKIHLKQATAELVKPTLFSKFEKSI
jgi:hypothetical protein